jgi:hypothetical protein
LGLGVLTSVAPANAAYVTNTILVSEATNQPGVCAADNAPGVQAVTIVTGSSFVLTTDVGASDNAYVSLSGNITISGQSGYDTVTTTTALVGTPADGHTLTIRAGSVGTGKITISTDSSSAAVEVITVTIVATCTNQVYSAATSFVYAAVVASIGDGPAAATNVDDSGATTVTMAEANGYISIALADSYGGPLASKAMVATVTSGNAYVSIDDTEGTGGAYGGAAAAAKTAVVPSTGEEVTVMVSPITAGVPTVATVQVTHDGVLVATKTFTFHGVASKIEISEVTVGSTEEDKRGNTEVGYFRYQIKDAAGNALPGKSLANDTVANSATAVSSITSGIDNDSVTGSLGEKTPSASSTTSNDQATYACDGAKTGATKVYVQHVETTDITVVVKTSFDVVCSGALDTWTVSLDKASYSPGEIATFTVTGKDEDGLPVGSLLEIGSAAISFGGFLAAVTAPTDTDTFSSGAGTKTYSYPVNTTEGSFVGSYKITGATDTAAKTLQYKVAAASGAVSMADFLKAIVSLIASINKQIAALQKALLKK